jgi:hypothetical protein
VHSLVNDEHPFCIPLIPKSNQISGRLRSYNWLALAWASFKANTQPLVLEGDRMFY